MTEYLVPNRAVANTIIASSPINENWEDIQTALNRNYDLASQVVNKVDSTLLGVSNGVATLNNDSKLNEEQLPESARGHIYEAANLYEQLSLSAFPGDLCVRKDIDKTYCLSVEPSSSFGNWIEISSINSGGEIGGNPCFTASLEQDKWELDGDSYKLVFTNDEHGQGNTRFLLVDIKREDGQDIVCHYTVEDDGTVTITTDVPFDALIMISNLSGNIKNSQYIPYCVMSGPEDIDGKGEIFSRSLHSINLITSKNIILVDGLNFVRNISSAVTLDVPTSLEPGPYVLFCDSSKIENRQLTELTYIKKSDYLGILTSFPSTARQGQRCYIAYDKSYEYSNGSWSAKAFTPLGEFTVENEYVASVVTYPFKSNNIDVTKNSHVLDYLFNNSIEGLNISIDEYLIVTPGKCLINNKLVTIPRITKNYNLAWQEGDFNGCYLMSNIISYKVSDGETDYYTSSDEQSETVSVDARIYYDEELTNFYKLAEENEFTYTSESSIVPDVNKYGWGYIYLIEGNDNVDIAISYESNPILPLGFYNFRLIGYFYKDENQTILKCMTDNNIVYLENPIVAELVNNKIETEIPSQYILVNVTAETETDFELYLNNFLINSLATRNCTLLLNKDTNFSSVDLAIRILGYRNERTA